MGYTGKIHNGKFLISIDRGPYFEVEEPVFRDIIRANGRVWKVMHKLGKCGTANYKLCDGECDRCRFRKAGFNMLSLADVYSEVEENDDLTPEEPIADPGPLIEEIVMDKLLLGELFERLNRLTPDGADIFKMMASGASEREITRRLGISAQSTTNYRCKKIRSFLKENWNEYFETKRK